MHTSARNAPLADPGRHYAEAQADHVPRPSTREFPEIITPPIHHELRDEGEKLRELQPAEAVCECEPVEVRIQKDRDNFQSYVPATKTEPGRFESSEKCIRFSDNESALLSECEQVPTYQTSQNPKDVAARERCPLHLIPPVAENEEAWVLGSGAAKYGAWNWRDEKISLMNYLGAMRRHINRILDGEDIDAESGLQHLAHVRATAGIVMDAWEHDCVIDDRPSWGARKP